MLELLVPFHSPRNPIGTQDLGIALPEQTLVLCVGMAFLEDWAVLPTALWLQLLQLL